jgi:phospholipid/cholesterol/gamma-HCH transport system substrate-binding protein
MKNAASVGVLVVVFVGLLIGAYAALGRTLLAPKQTMYSATFADANGVVPGTRILMAGVKVGTVGEVKLESPTQARVQLLIDEKISIPTGTVVYSPTSLIGFGDSPVMLQPPAAGGAPLAAGSTLEGRKGSPLEGILPGSKDTLAEVNGILKEIKKIVADRSTQANMKALLANSQETAKKFGVLADQMSGLLAENRGEVNTAIARGAKAVGDVQRITALVAKLLEEGKLQRGATDILQQLKSTSKRADQLVAQMNTLVADPNIKKITSNVADLTEQGKSIAANVETISKSGITIAEDAKVIAKNGATASANAVTITEKTNNLLDGAIDLENRVKSLLESVEKKLGGNGPKLPDVETRLEAARTSKPSLWRTDVNARFHVGGGNLDIGVYDAFESNKLTVQYGEPVNARLGYRYGIYASKPSVGVDYSPSKRLTWRNDLWDLNNPRFDSRLSYEFGNGFYGFAGIDHIFKDNAPIFGIGVRR